MEPTYSIYFKQNSKKYWHPREIRYLIDQDTALTIYNTLINSYINYCNSIWGNNYLGRYDNVTKIQKKALRLVNYTRINYQAHPSNRLEHTAPLFSKFNILNIQKLAIYNIAIIMYKIWNQTLVTPTLYRIIHRPPNDRSNKVLIPHVRTNIGKQSFSYSGPKIWNYLPDNLKSSSSISMFKNKCKNYLIHADASSVGSLFWTTKTQIIHT